jgi:hypothetical protein
LAVTFRVLGGDDETPFATMMARHMDVRHEIVDIDPNDIGDFETALQAMNAPYYGALSMVPTVRAVLQGGRDAQTIFSGQDTRLHTPYFTKLDEWFVTQVAGRPAAYGPLQKAASTASVMFAGIFGQQHNLARAARLVAQSPTWMDAVLRRYHKRQTDGVLVPPWKTLGIDPMMRQLIQDAPYGRTKDLRALFNAVVSLGWSGQYVCDMQYLRDTCFFAGARCALPFYDMDLAHFSARLPYNLITRTIPGTASFDADKKTMVNKAFLRQAFSRDLAPEVAGRAKAVANEAAAFCNGGLRPLLKRLAAESRLWSEPALTGIDSEAARALIREKDGRWRRRDQKLAMQVISLLAMDIVTR